MRQTFFTLLFSLFLLNSCNNTHSDYTVDGLTLINDLLNNLDYQNTKLKKYSHLDTFDEINDFTISKTKYIDLLISKIDSIEKLHDQNKVDFTNEFFILNRKAADLKLILDEYKSFMIEYFPKSKDQIKKTFDSILNTYDPKPENGQLRSWESITFEDVSMDVIKAKLLLYKYQILKIELETLDSLRK